MLCPQCGNPHDNFAILCASCGTNLSQPAQRRQEISSSKGKSKNNTWDEMVSNGGSSNGLWKVLAYSVLTIAFFGMSGYVAISSQQTYTVKDYVASAAVFGQSAADAVANYEYEHQQAPKNLEQAGFAETLPGRIKKISFDSQRGVVVVTMSEAPVEGKTLLIVPTRNANEKTIWKCMCWYALNITQKT